MKKELIINGVKYVRYEELKTYQIYDLVKYNGYEWIVINVKDDKLTLMMKKCLSPRKLKEIFNKEYLTEYDCIKYSLDGKCSDWNKTKIKIGLNNEFLKEFNKEELVKMKTNFDENKYSFDYIRIPNIREIEILDSNRVKPNFVCWTMSPSSSDATNGNAMEWRLNSTGSLSSGWYITHGYGARPIITLKSNNQNIKKISKEL